MPEDWKDVAMERQAKLETTEAQLHRLRHLSGRYGTILLVLVAMLAWALWKAVTG